ncbi:MAG: helix-turn-helix domain-containing protein [Candidatus Binatia bacterium]
MRKILSEDEIRLISRRLGKVMSPIFGELSSLYGVNIEDTVRFQAVATRLREAREHRGMDFKAAAKALGIPQYRLRDIEECRLKNLKSSALRRYIDFLGLGRWFARWRKANPKLAARLGPDQKSGSK